MPKKISSMKKQTSTTKYAVHGHSHDHLFHLLEQLQVPLDKLSEHGPHCHCKVQELAYCPLFRGMTQREHDAFLDRNVREILTFKKRETVRSEEHTSELQSRPHLVCRLLLEKKKKK